MFVAVVMIGFIAITAFVTIHHEPWRDEADSWLIVRDGGLAAVFERASYAGTPSLWYVLIAPLVKLGLPYAAQSILNLAIVWAAMLLFLIAAPFPRTVRALFAFSFYPAYEYAVIARPYALMMLLLFAAAACWRKRDEHPLRLGIVVALLANSTTHGLILAAILGAVFAADALLRRRWPVRTLVAAGIMIAGGLASYLQLLPPDDHPGLAINVDRADIAGAFGFAFFPTLPRLLAIGGAVAVLAAAALTLRRYAAFFVVAALAALGLIYYFFWLGGPRHAGLLLLAVLAGLWMSDRPLHRWTFVALSIALAWSVAAAGQLWIREWGGAFSDAEEMAAFIRANDLAQYEIAAHNFPPAQALLPYLDGKQFWYAALGRHGSYLDFDAEYERAIRVPYNDAVKAARRRFAGSRWLLLLNVPIVNPERYGFRLLYATRGEPFGSPEERFWLYAAR